MDVQFTFANGYNLPPFFMRDKVVIVAYDKNGKATQVTDENGSTQPQHQYPLTLKVKGLEDFTFPIDPIIGIGFKNVITRRTVSKGEKRGTCLLYTSDAADERIV